MKCSLKIICFFQNIAGICESFCSNGVDHNSRTVSYTHLKMHRRMEQNFWSRLQIPLLIVMENLRKYTDLIFRYRLWTKSLMLSLIHI